MPVDRKRWKVSVGGLDYPCPSCERGTLGIVPKTFHFREGYLSRVTTEASGGDPSFQRFQFSTLLQCNRALCEEVVSVSGAMSVDLVQVDHDEWDEYRAYYISSMLPTPLPVELPASTPELVTDRVVEAASLFWTDRDACANRLRQAMDEILTKQGIRRFKLPGAAKREKLSTHARIEMFKAKNATAADLMMATKWIGNSGSHDGGLDVEGVVDAFEMTEAIIQEVYVRHVAKLLKKAGKINARKKPL